MLDSIWRSNLIYAMFGILNLKVILLCLSLCAVSIVQTYHMIINKNYHWWWRSFCIGALGGVYLEFFAIYYMFYYTNYTLGGTSSEVFYSIQMFFTSVCFGTMCGSVTLLSSYFFVERIYNAGTYTGK